MNTALSHNKLNRMMFRLVTAEGELALGDYELDDYEQLEATAKAARERVERELGRPVEDADTIQYHARMIEHLTDVLLQPSRNAREDSPAPSGSSAWARAVKHLKGDK